MNNTRRRAMMTAAMVIAAPVALPAQETSSASTGRGTIVVSGEGQQMVKPDRATLFLSVETRARTSLLAGTGNAERMKAIRDGLIAMGLKSDQLSTQTYMLHPQQDKEGKIIAFLATNAVRVELRDLEMVSRVVDTALVIGASRIGGLSYSAGDSKPAMRKALGEAVETARARATAIAEASGGTLGELVEVTGAQNAGYAMQLSRVMVTSGMSGGSPGTEIDHRDIPVIAHVTVRWRFLPAK